jgi:hypothetical protein
VATDQGDPINWTVLPAKGAEARLAAARGEVTVLGDPDSPDSLVIMNGPSYLSLKYRGHVVAGIISGAFLFLTWLLLMRCIPTSLR